jgi:hypothetical protein
MPRSFRSVLAHADELLAGPGDGVAKVEVRRASTGKTRHKARVCPAILNQRLFEWSQKDPSKRA